MNLHEETINDDVSMLVWLISNWASSLKNIPLKILSLVEFLVNLLAHNYSQKLNHLIIYSLLNLCSENLVR
jgi:hypothetical protein